MFEITYDELNGFIYELDTNEAIELIKTAMFNDYKKTINEMSYMSLIRFIVSDLVDRACEECIEQWFEDYYDDIKKFAYKDAKELYGDAQSEVIERKKEWRNI